MHASIHDQVLKLFAVRFRTRQSSPYVSYRMTARETISEMVYNLALAYAGSTGTGSGMPNCGLCLCIPSNDTRLYLSFIHTSQFFLGKFIPANFIVKSKLCQFGGKFSRRFFSKWKKTEISAAYFRFNLLLLISIFSAVLKENAN